MYLGYFLTMRGLPLREGRAPTFSCWRKGRKMTFRTPKFNKTNVCCRLKGFKVIALVPHLRVPAFFLTREAYFELISNKNLWKVSNDPWVASGARRDASRSPVGIGSSWRSLHLPASAPHGPRTAQSSVPGSPGPVCHSWEVSCKGKPWQPQKTEPSFKSKGLIHLMSTRTLKPRDREGSK